MRQNHCNHPRSPSHIFLVGVNCITVSKHISGNQLAVIISISLLAVLPVAVVLVVVELKQQQQQQLPPPPPSGPL